MDKTDPRKSMEDKLTSQTCVKKLPPHLDKKLGDLVKEIEGVRWSLVVTQQHYKKVVGQQARQLSVQRRIIRSLCRRLNSHDMGIEEEEQKALAKLPSIHMMANIVEEKLPSIHNTLEDRDSGGKNEERFCGNFRWEGSKGENAHTVNTEEVNEEENEEEEERREVLTGKSLGVIAEDSDSAVHLDYSSDSLRSEKGRSERGNCERGHFERGQCEIDQPSERSSEKMMERLPSTVMIRESRSPFDQQSSPVLNARGGGPFDTRITPVLNPGGGFPFDRSTPVLKHRGLGLQRSVSDVVEAEFPSPFSDSRYRGFLLRHPKRSRDYSPAILQAGGGGVERWGSSRTCQTPRSVKARRKRQGEASSGGENTVAVIV